MYVVFDYWKWKSSKKMCNVKTINMQIIKLCRCFLIMYCLIIIIIIIN